MKEAKVCPSCGFEPWKDCGQREDKKPVQPNFCEECGDKLILRSELPRDIWKDPGVKERLKEGRPAWEIQCLRCPECDEFGYYNEGSTFSCRFCDVTFYVCSDEDAAEREGVRTVSSSEMVSLSDTVTECGDGYHNRTL